MDRDEVGRQEEATVFGVHTPPTQVSVLAHTVPQLPQLFGSVLVLVHIPEQRVSPAAQACVVEVVELVDVEVEVVEVDVEVVVDVVVVVAQLGQQFVLERTVPPSLVQALADFSTSHPPSGSLQVTYPADWPQVEAAMQLRIAELHCLAKPLATITLCMQATYAEWLVNELQGHWLSNWGCNEHRTASQSTGAVVVVLGDAVVVVVDGFGFGAAAAGALCNTSAVRNAMSNGKASLGVNRLAVGVIWFTSLASYVSRALPCADGRVT